MGNDRLSQERNIYSENGYTTEKDAQFGLEAPFVEMFKAYLGKALRDLLSFDTCLLDDIQRSFPTQIIM